jgi:hypothetical protein
MPFFKTTVNIVKDNDEYFDPNWMDSDTLKLPPHQEWDYQRDMQIEDVDLWEVIYESGSIGLYAAWQPHAEFYLFKPPWQMLEKGWGLETYYGANAVNKAEVRLKEFGVTLPKHKVWVEPEDLWLYYPKES